VATGTTTRKGVLDIWRVMRECAYRGCHSEGMPAGRPQREKTRLGANKKLLGGRKYEGSIPGLPLYGPVAMILNISSIG